MKRQSPAKSKKTKTPPDSKNPKVFEDAFEKTLGQHPADYLIEKLQGGSSVSSIEYLFDILSADIAMKNHCTSKGFDYYHIIAQERMKAMRKRTVHNKLVRDRIPEIIEASGNSCITETLSDEEYLRMIDAKLDEELAEYHKDQNIEELAEIVARKFAT